LAGVALVQIGGDQKSALESHRTVSLDRQGDPLEKIHGFAWVSCNARQSVAQFR